MRRLFIILVAFSYFSAFSQTNMLFVGNSLTYTNNLPSLLETIAKADDVVIKTEMIAFPNYALEDHWNERNVSSTLSKTKFDYVIFQQGPSGLPASRQNLIQYALKFSEMCKAKGTLMCMYGVWPSVDRAFDFPNVIASYQIAADTCDAILLPAGKAWKSIIDQHKTFPLYSSDGFHPSIQGSILSALVIYTSLFKKQDLDFLTVTNLPPKSLTAQQLDVIKRAALHARDN
ncbi:MAG TPA: SGNH/GDSL hydrolase family protein [Chryseosolibacter sp.]